MVAPNITAGFAHGQAVRLLVGVLAWPAPRPAWDRLPMRRPGADQRPVDLSPADRLTFNAYHPAKRGAVIVLDDLGFAWVVPEGFLTAGLPT